MYIYTLCLAPEFYFEITDDSVDITLQCTKINNRAVYFYTMSRTDMILVSVTAQLYSQLVAMQFTSVT